MKIEKINKYRSDQSRSFKKGFTLIESVLVIVLVGVIAFVFAFYIREVFGSWLFISAQKSMALSSKAAIYRMVREIKRINDNRFIYTYASKEVTFRDLSNNTITYMQSGPDLYRNNEVVLDNLLDPCGLNFAYLDGSGTDVTTKDAIKTIRIRLTTVKDENKFVIESAAMIRPWRP